MRIILINKNNFLNWGNKTMMKFKLSKLLLIALMFNLSVSANIFAQEDSSDPEEIIVRGKVLYSDQVTALKTPIPISVLGWIANQSVTSKWACNRANI